MKAGATGTTWVKLGDGGSTSTFLLAETPTDGAGAGLALAVPAPAPEETYDLAVFIPSLSISDQQANGLKVVKETSDDVTFLVITDTNFNNPTGFLRPGNLNPTPYDAYTIIQQMMKEIRALHPTFVIARGASALDSGHRTGPEKLPGPDRTKGMSLSGLVGVIHSLEDLFESGRHFPATCARRNGISSTCSSAADVTFPAAARQTFRASMIDALFPRGV